MNKKFTDLRAIRMTGDEPDKFMAAIYQRMLEQGDAHDTKLPATAAGMAKGIDNLRMVLRQDQVDIFRIDAPGTVGAGAIFLSPLVTGKTDTPVFGCQLDDIVTARGLRGRGIGGFGLAAAALVARRRGGIALALECEEGMRNESGILNADFYDSNGLSLRAKHIPYRINHALLTALTEEARDPSMRITVTPLAQVETLRQDFRNAAALFAGRTVDQGAALHPAWEHAAWQIRAEMPSRDGTRIFPLATAIASRRWSMFRTAKLGQAGFDDGQGKWEQPVGAQIEWMQFEKESIDKIRVGRAMIRALTHHMRTEKPGACSFIDWVGLPWKEFDSGLAKSFAAEQNTYSGAPERLWKAQDSAFLWLGNRLKPEQLVL